MFLKPAPNPNHDPANKDSPKFLKMRDPVLKDFLPDEGREVKPSPYWTRRLRDKSVIEVKAQQSQLKVLEPVAVEEMVSEQVAISITEPAVVEVKDEPPATASVESVIEEVKE
jgi:hypothetical protein